MGRTRRGRRERPRLPSSYVRATRLDHSFSSDHSLVFVVLWVCGPGLSRHSAGLFSAIRRAFHVGSFCAWRPSSPPEGYPNRLRQPARRGRLDADPRRRLLVHERVVHHVHHALRLSGVLACFGESRARPRLVGSALTPRTRPRYAPTICDTFEGVYGPLKTSRRLGLY